MKTFHLLCHAAAFAVVLTLGTSLAHAQFNIQTWVGRSLGHTEIAPELTGHGLPLGKCEAYNRVYEQF